MSATGDGGRCMVPLSDSHLSHNVSPNVVPVEIFRMNHNTGSLTHRHTRVNNTAYLVEILDVVHSCSGHVLYLLF